MADEDKPMSQKAADEIARLTELQAEWEKFESPEEVEKRRVYQAQILGEAMLKLSARVPAEWHATMLEVAKDEEELVKRERLISDGWRFGKGSNGNEFLDLPQQPEKSQTRTPP